jgi:hypothetical protein
LGQGYHVNYVPSSISIDWASSSVNAALVVADTYAIYLYYTNMVSVGPTTPVLVSTTLLNSGSQPNFGNITVVGPTGVPPPTATSTWTILVDTTTGGKTARGFALGGKIVFNP